MDWDSALKVWAVVGPLLAAGASAAWSHYVRVSDRSHEKELEKERAARASLSERISHLRAYKSARHAELKAALADFMSSSREFVRKQSESLSRPTPENVGAATQANDKFSYSCQLVILLGDQELADAAVTLWNAALVVPRSYSTLSDDAYQETLSVYRNAGAAFNASAKRFLAAFDGVDV
jgi:hypothetical protein